MEEEKAEEGRTQSRRRRLSGGEEGQEAVNDQEKKKDTVEMQISFGKRKKYKKKMTKEANACEQDLEEKPSLFPLSSLVFRPKWATEVLDHQGNKGIKGFFDT